MLSQAGLLFSWMRLFDESISCLKSAVEIDEQLSDTVNIIYDLQRLGDVYLEIEDYENAEVLFRKTFELSENLPDYHIAKSQMYLAYIKCCIGQKDSALYLIEGLEERVKPSLRYDVMSYATIINFSAGRFDSAYAYSKKIIESQDTVSKFVAYQTILSPQIIKDVPVDSLGRYIWDYRVSLERFFDNNNYKMVINQRNVYNYELHVKEKERIIEYNLLLQKIVFIIVIISLLMLLALLLYKNQNQKTKLELHKAIDNIKILKKELAYSSVKPIFDDGREIITPMPMPSTIIEVVDFFVYE